MTSSGTNQVKNKYYVCFDSQPKLFDLKLRETWKYRELIWLFTRKSLVRRYKQTILGPLWLILTPLLTSIMYTIIFGTVAGIDTAGNHGSNDSSDNRRKYHRRCIIPRELRNEFLLPGLL